MEQIREVPIAVLDDSRFGLTVIQNIFTLNKVKNVKYFTDPVKFLDEINNFSIFFVDMVFPHALMFGADDYITKPFSNTIFMARLKANARSFFLNRQLRRQAVSDGLTQYRDGDAEALIKEADDLLYTSKKNGRNRITVSSF